eukprot:GHVN01075658.1.p1 GENE.GHVN01075658.1~~GHVN01075658.1.p1  ORF type:complete len:244 (+),score=32.13 GHVN01075658.1:231-962(+)
MKFQREVAVLMMLFGLLALSNGENTSSRPSEEGQMVEQAVRLEQLTDQSGATANYKYAKKVTVTCSLPTCSPLIFHYAVTPSPFFYYHSVWRTAPQTVELQTGVTVGHFVAHFELDGPADEHIHFPPEMTGYQNPTHYLQQYHYKREKVRYFFLEILSLNGRKSDDDLQFHEYEMKYASKTGSTDTLFNFCDGEKYSGKWSAVLDSDGVNGHKPAYVNWKYDIEGDEFLIEITDHQKDQLEVM